MILLTVSANPLFEEVILDLISRCEISEVVSTAPENAAECIHRTRPGVIILDNTIEARLIDEVLAVARLMENLRIVLVNPGNNDFVIIDSRRSTVGTIEDLIRVIQ